MNNLDRIADKFEKNTSQGKITFFEFLIFVTKWLILYTHIQHIYKQELE